MEKSTETPEVSKPSIQVTCPTTKQPNTKPSNNQAVKLIKRPYSQTTIQCNKETILIAVNLCSRSGYRVSLRLPNKKCCNKEKNMREKQQTITRDAKEKHQNKPT